MTQGNHLWHRFRPLAGLALVVVSISTLIRLLLVLAARDDIPFRPDYWFFMFGSGLGYDLLVLVYFSWPLVLWLWLAPRWLQTRLTGRVLQWGLCSGLVLLLLFVAVAEWTFWEEFQTRFNFIAVDYLVYTTEVLGNIRESYPLGLILPGIGILALAIVLVLRRWWRVDDGGSTFAGRSAVAFVWLLLTLAGTVGVRGDMKNRTDNQYVNELAGNGIHEFFAAFRNASLNYDRFYQTLPRQEAFAELRRLLTTPDARFVSDDPLDVTRDIINARPERRLNVVLISIESLSAWFSGAYGRTQSLTPQMDALSDKGLFFSRLMASGTRTVRGLEALTLSVPPTPGESIVKRPGNEGLFSLADVFNRKGYVSEFLYGGYGAFDNMNYFYANNGYEVRDRAAIASDSISHATIWGVADEDLYTLALQEFDQVHASGQPFFAHLLTTSNHRPYTFPEGRVDMPQGARDSAVAYTDWAVGDFLRRARDKPWFDDTVFVITADHCASSGGIARLPVFRYHIPLWIFSPKHIAPQRIDRMMAQIDIGPTLLGLLGMDYRSQFYGADLFELEPGRERALIGNYQRLGYLHDNQLIELAPHREVRSVRPDYDENRVQPELPLDRALALQAIGYYQTASYLFSHGLMRTRESAMPPAPVMGAPLVRAAGAGSHD